MSCSVVLFNYAGMGTSSILAGAVLAALLTAGGKTFDTKGLIHAVSGIHPYACVCAFATFVFVYEIHFSFM